MKPCPFCGSENLENLVAASYGADAVHCIDCGARGPCRLDALEERAGRVSDEEVNDGIDAWEVRLWPAS